MVRVALAFLIECLVDLLLTGQSRGWEDLLHVVDGLRKIGRPLVLVLDLLLDLISLTEFVSHHIELSVCLSLHLVPDF